MPIPGTKHLKFAEENAKAAALEISEEDLAKAGQIFGEGAVLGDRLQ